MARITEDQKLQMNILYKTLGSYAAVARQIGCAPSTVKRYIIKDFEMPEGQEKERKIVLPSFDTSNFIQANNLAELLSLSDAEKDDIIALRKEFLV